MKRSFKKLLLTSLVLFILGTILCAAALIYAAVTDVNIFDNTQSNPAENYSVKLSEVKKSGVLDFTRLYIHGEDLDITVCGTEEESYIAFNEPDEFKTSCIIENGILRITDTVPFYIMGLSVTDLKPKFTGFRNIFTSGLYSTTDKSVTVYLNNSTSLESIEINVGIGNVKVSDISSKSISSSAVIGDITLQDNNVSEKINIDCSNGDVVLKNCTYAFADISTSVGDIDVYHPGRKTNCEASIGNISVTTDDDPYAYSSRAVTSSGKIVIDETVQPGKEFTNNSDSESSLWLKNIIGTISLYNSVTNE